MADMQIAQQWLKQQHSLIQPSIRSLRLIASLSGLIIVLQAFLIAHLLSSIIIDKKTLDDLWPPLISLPPLFALRYYLSYQAEQLTFKAGSAIKQSIREKLLQTLARLGPVALANEESGSVSTTIIDGIESLDAYFVKFLPTVIIMSMVPLIIWIVVIPSDWLSATVLMVTAPLTPLFMMLVGKHAERLNQQQWNKLARMGGHFLSAIQNLTTLKRFGASKREIENIGRIADEFRRSTMGVLRIAFLTSAILEFFAALSIALVAVFIGFRLLEGHMSFFYGFFVLLLIPEFYLPLRQFGVQSHARMEANSAAEHIIRLLDLKEPASFDVTHETAIKFDQMSYRYNDKSAAINRLSLSISNGEKIAITGKSGSGKSTLLSLLLGFISPSEGKLSTPSRHEIAWVPQKAKLFYGSIAKNVAMSQTLSDNDIKCALRAAQADFILALPHGIHTHVEEGGRNFSGGQTQRIALARALAKRAPILLLDEPTAHLDDESEAAITSALNNLSHEITTITIAHRLSTLQKADRIIVLDKGQIVEEGDYKTLSQSSGPFEDLLNSGQELLA
jgi:ATP-binding cassette subfamily C protein CydD